MHEIIVIADTSCLIALSKIEAIDLLEKLYQEVYITEEIAKEFGDKLPNWIKIERVRNQRYQQLLDLYLDPGEASAIAFALDLKNVLLILDDLKGRKEAERLGLTFTGTLGILFKAKKQGFVEELKPFIENLKIVGFRISKNIEDEILKRSGEN